MKFVDIDTDQSDDVKRSISEKEAGVFLQALKDFSIVYTGYLETIEQKKGKRKLFSICCRELEKALQKANNGEGIEPEPNESGLPDNALSILQRVLSPQHEFVVSKENLDLLWDEIWVLYKSSSVSELFHFAILQDQKYRLAKIKSLYAMGKAVFLIDELGRARSDRQAERGSKDSKKHIEKQAVWEAFFRVEWEGLKISRIGEKIEKYLQEIEEGKPKSKQRKVYCGDYIAKKILPKDEKIKEILLREGILKK